MTKFQKAIKMKNLKSINPKAFKGAGYIIGATIGFIAAITVFVFTERIALAIPLLAGLSIPLGISFEQKIQGETNENEPRIMKIMVTLIALGVLFFVSFVLLAKYI